MAASIINKKKISEDLLYSIGAAILLNSVLQFIIYPLLNRHIGEQEFGNVVFYIGIVSIFSTAVGSGLNNARLMLRRTTTTSNADFLILLLIFGISGGIVGAFIVASTMNDIGTLVAYIFLIFFTCARFYADVGFRISLNYRRYFLYYVILSLGYIAGTVAAILFNNWIFIFLVGELSALIFTVINGIIFKKEPKSTNFNYVIKYTSPLIISYLFTNLALNLERIVLLFFIDGVAVSEYYVVSLIGKTAAMLILPINGMILSYLSRSKSHFRRRQYLICSAVLLGFGILAYIIFIFVTPIFVNILYPNLAYAVKDLNIIVNLAAVMNFISTILLAVILSFTSARVQMIIRGSYLVIYSIISVIFTFLWGVTGFALATLVANSIYLIFTFFAGYFNCKRE